jgi:hypothetical protein
MFVTLLVVDFAVAVVVSLVVARTFRGSIDKILQRLIGEDIYTAWSRYIVFALYVVGISGGVRVWQLERYISPRARDEPILALTAERWTLEIYRTVIGTLQGVAWTLLVFFVVALVAFVVLRAFEMRRPAKP